MAASMRTVCRAIQMVSFRSFTHKQVYYVAPLNLSVLTRRFADESVKNEVESEVGEKQDEAAATTKKQPVPVIPVETSLRYMESQAYNTTYGGEPVWTHYRRNFKGAWAPRKTRKSCIRQGIMNTGNPCPICRDEYLVLDYQNTKLLKQFISPITGQVLEATKTGICRLRQSELEVAILKAKDYGN